MTFKDIVTKKTYTKDGVEKVKWSNIGTLKITDEGKMFIELAMFPNTDFYVFERKPKEGAPAIKPADDGRDDAGFVGSDEISPDEIPF